MMENGTNRTDGLRAEDPAQRPQVKTAIEARQGVISGRVVTVLAASLLLVVVALVGAYLLAR
jgi:heme O synthase-like polyprenyltransferase